MLAAFGVDVLDPGVSTRRVQVLLERIPPSARRGGEQWSTEADLLAALVDHVAYLTWVTLKAHGAKGAAKPKPVPRPKRSPVNAAAESARKRAVDAARAQPRALAGTVTDAPAKAASWADAILAIAKVPGVRTERDATSLRPPGRRRDGRHHAAGGVGAQGRALGRGDHPADVRPRVVGGDLGGAARGGGGVERVQPRLVRGVLGGLARRVGGHVRVQPRRVGGLVRVQPRVRRGADGGGPRRVGGVVGVQPRVRRGGRGGQQRARPRVQRRAGRRRARRVGGVVGVHPRVRVGGRGGAVRARPRVRGRAGRGGPRRGGGLVGVHPRRGRRVGDHQRARPRLRVGYAGGRARGGERGRRVHPRGGLGRVGDPDRPGQGVRGGVDGRVAGRRDGRVRVQPAHRLDQRRRRVRQRRRRGRGRGRPRRHAGGAEGDAARGEPRGGRDRAGHRVGAEGRHLLQHAHADQPRRVHDHPRVERGRRQDAVGPAEVREHQPVPPAGVHRGHPADGVVRHRVEQGDPVPERDPGHRGGDRRQRPDAERDHAGDVADPGGREDHRRRPHAVRAARDQRRRPHRVRHGQDRHPDQGGDHRRVARRHDRPRRPRQGHGHQLRRRRRQPEDDLVRHGRLHEGRDARHGVGADRPVHRPQGRRVRRGVGSEARQRAAVGAARRPGGHDRDKPGHPRGRRRDQLPVQHRVRGRPGHLRGHRAGPGAARRQAARGVGRAERTAHPGDAAGRPRRQRPRRRDAGDGQYREVDRRRGVQRDRVRAPQRRGAGAAHPHPDHRQRDHVLRVPRRRGARRHGGRRRRVERRAGGDPHGVGGGHRGGRRGVERGAVGHRGGCRVGPQHGHRGVERAAVRDHGRVERDPGRDQRRVDRHPQHRVGRRERRAGRRHRRVERRAGADRPGVERHPVHGERGLGPHPQRDRRRGGVGAAGRRERVELDLGDHGPAVERDLRRDQRRLGPHPQPDRAGRRLGAAGRHQRVERRPRHHGPDLGRDRQHRARRVGEHQEHQPQRVDVDLDRHGEHVERDPRQRRAGVGRRRAGRRQRVEQGQVGGRRPGAVRGRQDRQPAGEGDQRPRYQDRDSGDPVDRAAGRVPRGRRGPAPGVYTPCRGRPVVGPGARRVRRRRHAADHGRAGGVGADEAPGARARLRVPAGAAPLRRRRHGRRRRRRGSGRGHRPHAALAELGEPRRVGEGHRRRRREGVGRDAETRQGHRGRVQRHAAVGRRRGVRGDDLAAAQGRRGHGQERPPVHAVLRQARRRGHRRGDRVHQGQEHPGHHGRDGRGHDQPRHLVQRPKVRLGRRGEPRDRVRLLLVRVLRGGHVRFAAAGQLQGAVEGARPGDRRLPELGRDDDHPVVADRPRRRGRQQPPHHPVDRHGREGVRREVDRHRHRAADHHQRRLHRAAVERDQGRRRLREDVQHVGRHGARVRRQQVAEPHHDRPRADRHGLVAGRGGGRVGEHLPGVDGRPAVGGHRGARPHRLDPAGAAAQLGVHPGQPVGVDAAADTAGQLVLPAEHGPLLGAGAAAERPRPRRAGHHEHGRAPRRVVPEQPVLPGDRHLEGEPAGVDRAHRLQQRAEHDAERARHGRRRRAARGGRRHRPVRALLPPRRARPRAGLAAERRGDHRRAPHHVRAAGRAARRRRDQRVPAGRAVRGGRRRDGGPAHRVGGRRRADMTTPPTEATRGYGPGAERGYDRDYDRAYTLEPDAPPPPPPPVVPPAPPEDWTAGAGRLVPVVWHGMDLDPGWVSEWFTAIVENVEGWYASPPLNGGDAERALADGGFYGLKTLGPREVTITGSCIGPRADIMGWRDRIAGLAAERQPSELAVTDPWLGTTRTAMVRADSDTFSHEFFGGRRGWRYQVTVTAADPLLYGSTWKQAVLTNLSSTDTGRPYPRFYVHPREDQPEPPDGLNGWGYESSVPANSTAVLVNDGNVPAPVYAVWTGDLGPSTVTDDSDSIIMGGLAAGVQVAVDTATLVAEAPGGGNRSGMIAPGSRPMFVPPRSTALWHLYSTGSGSVTLLWRDAWA